MTMYDIVTITVVPIAASSHLNTPHDRDTIRPLVLSQCPACSDSVKTTLFLAKPTTALKSMNCRDAFAALLASFGAVPRSLAAVFGPYEFSWLGKFLQL